MSSYQLLKTRKGTRTWIALCVLIVMAVIMWFWSSEPRDVYAEYAEILATHKFAGFDNESGTKDGQLIVPNIVHFIVFDEPVVKFAHFICILAALKNQNPERIYFHINVARLEGVYWERLKKLKKFQDVYTLKRLEKPLSIWGQKFEPEFEVFHAGDIARIRVLMFYGGIYLDNDSYIVKSLDEFRKFEMTIGWDEGQYLGSQIIVAHKDARFLRLWLETYRGQYESDLWYYNTGELPTTSVLYKHPELVHRIKRLFGNDVELIHKLFGTYWKEWRTYYTFHLLARHGHQKALKNISAEATFPVEFNDENIQKYPITFREMANELLTYEKQAAKV